jgi:hypothetical protein
MQHLQRVYLPRRHEPRESYVFIARMGSMLSYGGSRNGLQATRVTAKPILFLGLSLQEKHIYMFSFVFSVVSSTCR